MTAKGTGCDTLYCPAVTRPLNFASFSAVSIRPDRFLRAACLEWEPLGGKRRGRPPENAEENQADARNLEQVPEKWKPDVRLETRRLQ